MRIVRLTAENVKRLRAVEISPDGNLVTITGRNAQGKTSVLDAIWLALGGGTAAKGTTRPVRDGEDSATVTLDLGDIIVTRSWSGTRSTLTVTSADGARYSSPQTMLDNLVGRLSFDPLEFTRLSSRDQRQALLGLVDLDVDLADLDRRRATLYDQRTEVGRQRSAAEGHLASLPDVPDGTPDAEVSAAELLATLSKAQAMYAEHEAVHDEAARAQTRREHAARALDEARADMERAEADERAVVARLQAMPDLPDMAPIREQIASVDQTNAAVRRKVERASATWKAGDLRERYDRFTESIAALDKEKAAALAAAAFPVDGLGFDESGVTYLGVPFSQASSAEQIRVSLAMAMALNPKLRVVRILDGSLLDEDNLALIAEMAQAQDYQVWIERVSDPSETAVVIEDGQVAS